MYLACNNNVILTLSAHAQQGNNSQFVCLSVCPFVTLLLTNKPFVHGHKIKYPRHIYDDFLDLDSQISLKRFCLRDIPIFAYRREP